MAFNNQSKFGQYKECAGRGCSEKGVNYLKILFINKGGWFCNSCVKILLDNGLAHEGIKESE
jgi:hypothetical protein